MDRANFEALRASSAFERFLMKMQDLLNRMMSTLAEAINVEVKVVQQIEVVEAALESVKVVVKVSKLPRTPRPKKDKQKQPMLPVCISPRNP